MRICLDLDGVICELKKEWQDYGDVGVIQGARESLKLLRESGHYIILHTARHMKTTKSNVGLVNALQGFKTLKWLEDNGIEYDEIYFGKPWADIYVDDNALKFTSWAELMKGSEISEN